MIIEDGKGSGVKAQVTKDSELTIQGTTAGPLEHASILRGRAGCISSTFATGGADVEVIYIENGEPELRFHVTRFLLTASAAAVWTILEATGGTAAGTSLTYQNPNLDSGVTKSLTAYGNAAVTGSVTGNILMQIGTAADAGTQLFVEGVILLGNGDKLAITCSANATVYVTVMGFWDLEDQNA